jgi:diketogulonate reductase-like aldo/keto reductase
VISHNLYVRQGPSVFIANEEEVGRAIRDSGIPREEIYITTKLYALFYATPSVSFSDQYDW